jgi:hypothetical protein
MKKVLYALIAIIGFGNAAMAQVPSYVPTNGLVGFWPFNGNANDESGNGNHGIPQNGTVLSNDRFNNSNKSYSFDGVNDYMSTPIIQSNINSYSVSIWFKTTDSVGWMFQGSRNCNSSIGNRLVIYLSKLLYGADASGYNDAVVTNSSFNDNQWHNVVGVWNGFGSSIISEFQFSIYVDGVFVNQTAQTSVGNGGIGGHRSIPINGTSTCSFGKESCNSSTFYYSGLLDDIGIWNRALTQQEIIKLYQGCNDSIITTEPTNTSVGVGLNAQFSTASATGSSYQWQADAAGLGWQNVSNNNQYSGANTNNLNVNNVSVSNQNQRFRVIAFKSGCTDTSDVALLNVTDTCLTKVTDTLIIQIKVGIPTPNISNTLLIYPNPAKDRIIIDNGNYTVMSGYSIKIQNSIGQQVFNSAITQPQFNIDLSTWTGKGIYYVRLLDASGNVVTTRKILLQ